MISSIIIVNNSCCNTCQNINTETYNNNNKNTLFSALAINGNLHCHLSKPIELRYPKDPRLVFVPSSLKCQNYAGTSFLCLNNTHLLEFFPISPELQPLLTNT